jgi:hypothetical protein
MPLPQRYHNPVSLPVLQCRPVSLSENDYESEGRRFESCRARLFLTITLTITRYGLVRVYGGPEGSSKRKSRSNRGHEGLPEKDSNLH